MKSLIFPIIIFMFLISSCNNSEKKEDKGTPYPEGHEYPIKAKALSERMKTFANNLPNPDSIQFMYLDSFPEETFNIIGNGMTLFLFDPEWVAQFGDQSRTDVVGNHHLKSTDNGYWDMFTDWTVDYASGLKNFENFENLDNRRHHELSQLVETENEFIDKGNFAVVYRLLGQEAQTDSLNSFQAGILAADIVLFSHKTMLPVGAYPVIVTNDEEIEYSYAPGESQESAARSAVAANLHGTFTFSIGNELSKKVKNRGGKYEPGYGTFSVSTR